MKNTYVFYRLKGDKYHLQYEGKSVFVDKEKWNNFIREQHNDKNEGLSLSGGIGVDPEELKKIIQGM